MELGAFLLCIMSFGSGWFIREYLYRKEEDDLEEWMMGVDRDE